MHPRVRQATSRFSGHRWPSGARSLPLKTVRTAGNEVGAQLRAVEEPVWRAIRKSSVSPFNSMAQSFVVIGSDRAAGLSRTRKGEAAGPPFQFDLASHDMAHFFTGAARLKPGVTVGQANAQLRLAADQYRRLYGANSLPADGGFGVVSLQESMHRRHTLPPAGPAGRSGLRSADRVRECCEPAAGASGGEKTEAGDAGCPGRGARPDRRANCSPRA